MSNSKRVIIVAALVISVAVIIALKQRTETSGAGDTAVTSGRNAGEVEKTVVEPENLPKPRKLPKMIDLGAGKCVPCKMMAPILEQIKKEYAGKFDVVFIDVWKNPEEAKKYNIKMIPTQLFYDVSGNELFRHEGFYSKEDIITKWKEFGVDLPG